MAQIPSRTIAKLHICASVGGIASKNKGKSGGARVITCLQVLKTAVYLLSIYDKSELDDIPDKELEALLRFIP